MKTADADLFEMLTVAQQRVADAIGARGRIVASLLDMGYTSRQLAEVAGVSHPTILSWAATAR